MHFFTMLIWVVAICVVGDIIKRAMSHNKVKPHNNHDEMEKLIEINEQLNARVKDLEARVISLEAIVTDEGYELKQKISGL